MWHIAYTKELKEIKFASFLDSKQITNFCPTSSFTTDSYGRGKTIIKPVLPGFVFLKATPEQLAIVRKSRHLINFMHWRDQPVQVPDDYIRAIKQFSAKYKNITPRMREVRMNENISRVVSHDNARLYLPLIGCELSSEFSVAPRQEVHLLHTHRSTIEARP